MWVWDSQTGEQVNLSMHSLPNFCKIDFSCQFTEMSILCAKHKILICKSVRSPRQLAVSKKVFNTTYGTIPFRKLRCQFRQELNYHLVIRLGIISTDISDSRNKITDYCMQVLNYIMSTCKTITVWIKHLIYIHNVCAQ